MSMISDQSNCPEEATPLIQNKRINLLLAQPGWHEGVLGL